MKMSEEKTAKVWERYEAEKYVKSVKAKLDAIGLPSGTEDEWGRKRYAEALAKYEEMGKGWQNEDMMAAALIDALEMAAVVSLTEAGGWAGWPKEPLARVSPNMPREVANPDSEGARKRAEIDALYDESIDDLMSIRGMKLGGWSPEKLRIQIGEYQGDPRKKYTFSNACVDLDWWLSEVYRLNLGKVGWLGSEAEWIRHGLEVIEHAKYVAENIRAKEKGIGGLAMEVADGAKLDEVPTPEKGMELFERMSGHGDETRMERLVRLGKELGELRKEYDTMPEWAKVADVRRA